MEISRVFKHSLCFIILLCIFPDVTSFKCWDCRSDLDPHCGDPFDNTTIPLSQCEWLRETPPAGTIPVCKKASIKVKGQHVIIRGCSWRQPSDKNCNDTFSSPNEKITSCITCENRDGCNGASTVTKVVALLFAPLGLLFFK